MERVLIFNYPVEYKDNVDVLKKVFSENKVEYICYGSDGCCPYCFKVRRSGKKWEDLYVMINSVRPAKYSFTKVNLEYIDGKLMEVV